MLSLSASFHETERESAFWTEFIEAKPHPPERLMREQYQIANRILASQYRFAQGGNPSRTNPQRLEQLQKSEISQAQELGSPAEALGKEALFWSYVMRQREEYTTHIVPLSNAKMVFTNWIGQLYVDQQCITEPLPSGYLDEGFGFVEDRPVHETGNSNDVCKIHYVRAVKQSERERFWGLQPKPPDLTENPL